ncbi:MAG: glucose-6-phosphate isomerase family protein [Methanolinea sp.]|nr:glucose-6-phosphate isomerase family protein [Methanolinea sp.]
MDDWKAHAGRPDVRDMAELRAVLRDPSCPLSGPAYYMYRDIARTPEDRAWLAAHRLRFDVTCIPPGDFCGEYPKTKGHYHPENPAGTGYPEVYEVLSGTAHFLLQREDLGAVALVPAGRGDTVLVPPGYGHVTINPGGEPLVVANVVASCFASDYRYYEEHRGAAYYELLGGTLERNPRYPAVPPPAVLSPPGPARPPWAGGPLYKRIEERDGNLSALVYPERYRWVPAGL